jgi:hypothetical protein
LRCCEMCETLPRPWHFNPQSIPSRHLHCHGESSSGYQSIRPKETSLEMPRSCSSFLRRDRPRPTPTWTYIILSSSSLSSNILFSSSLSSIHLRSISDSQRGNGIPFNYGTLVLICLLWQYINKPPTLSSLFPSFFSFSSFSLLPRFHHSHSLLGLFAALPLVLHSIHWYRDGQVH